MGSKIELVNYYEHWLQREAALSEEKVAASVVKSRARYVADNTRRALDSPTVASDHQNEANKSPKIEQYLKNINNSRKKGPGPEEGVNKNEGEPSLDDYSDNESPNCEPASAALPDQFASRC